MPVTEQWYDADDDSWFVFSVFSRKFLENELLLTSDRIYTITSLKTIFFDSIFSADASIYSIENQILKHSQNA